MYAGILNTNQTNFNSLLNKIMKGIKNEIGRSNKSKHFNIFVTNVIKINIFIWAYNLKKSYNI